MYTKLTIAYSLTSTVWLHWHGKHCSSVRGNTRAIIEEIRAFISLSSVHLASITGLSLYSDFCVCVCVFMVPGMSWLLALMLWLILPSTSFSLKKFQWCRFPFKAFPGQNLNSSFSLIDILKYCQVSGYSQMRMTRPRNRSPVNQSQALWS